MSGLKDTQVSLNARDLGSHTDLTLDRRREHKYRVEPASSCPSDSLKRWPMAVGETHR